MPKQWRTRQGADPRPLHVRGYQWRNHERQYDVIAEYKALWCGPTKFLTPQEARAIHQPLPYGQIQAAAIAIQKQFNPSNHEQTD